MYSQTARLKNIDEFDFKKTEILYLFRNEGKAFRAVKFFRSSFGRA